MKIITIIGSGLIGRSWATVFASGGYSVKLYDNQPGQAANAMIEIKKQMMELQEMGMLRGQQSATQQLALISSHEDLQQALQGAFFVQDCIFENLEAKQNLFRDVERLVSEDVILSSSTSYLVNPPYYVKLVELVPHPETLVAVMESTYALMTEVGQVPVRLKKEIDGFALNRVQAAIIAESWRLVQDGIISVQDIDLVMSEGLGMRYAFIGPMETMHLNAPEGLGDYMKRYGEGIQRVQRSVGAVPDFFSEDAKSIVSEMCDLVPNNERHLSARRARRDQLLMRLAHLKKDH
ncbi:lambda-crystallin homolog isoform X2 [Syngnathoides biaculeatus]|uniref:lambda-crystallin homolog isoform X2 n=1 Tax=Syngnathoides biaculeatus TaxID=300417 RepID=UPI002ADDAA8A|nr:lambda-crystallin homolog isoform X2 [Syngnathoides biaculeatus]